MILTFSYADSTKVLVSKTDDNRILFEELVGESVYTSFPLTAQQATELKGFLIGQGF